MAYLKVDLPGGKVLRHALEPNQTLIGRSNVCDLVIPDLALSRMHATILQEGDRYLMADHHSRNGTYVNHERVRDRIALNDGDLIRFGSCRAHFRAGELVTGEPLSSDLAETTWTEELAASSARVLLDSGVIRIRSDLSFAKEIQRFLLPSGSPVVSGYRFLGDTQPCFEVGGDFFDYYVRSDGRIGMVVADVARKGFGAALLGHYTQALLRVVMEYEPRLERLISKVNREVCLHSPPAQFVTAFLCVLEPTSGDLTYVNAGHWPPMLVHADASIERLGGRNLVLGFEPGFRYTAGKSHLPVGSTLLLYTDGVIECSDEEERQFGEERLEAFLVPRRDAPPERLMHDLEEELERFAGGSKQGDDITLLVAQRLPEEH
jgi:pSer/pThr/pTyr-binding forkhead associated (FHA) protein